MGATGAAARRTNEDHRVFRTAVEVGPNGRSPANSLGQRRALKPTICSHDFDSARPLVEGAAAVGPPP